MWIQSREWRAERALPLHAPLSSLASGPLEHVHLSLPLCHNEEQRGQRNPAVLWPSQVGTLTYVWWYGNNTEVSWLSGQGLWLLLSSKGKEITYTNSRAQELWQPLGMVGSESPTHLFSMSLSLLRYTSTSYPCLPVSQGSTWALLCSDQQQPELSVVTAQWSK